MILTDDGIANGSINPEQFVNVKLFISLSECDIFKLPVNPVQLQKEYWPKKCTESGIVKDP